MRSGDIPSMVTQRHESMSLVHIHPIHLIDDMNMQ